MQTEQHATVRMNSTVRRYVEGHYQTRSPVKMHAALLRPNVQCSLRSIQNLKYRLRKQIATNDIEECNSFAKEYSFRYSYPVELDSNAIHFSIGHPTQFNFRFISFLHL